MAKLQDELRGARRLFSGLTFYEKFEHAIVLVLTLLIVLIVAAATWHLTLAVFALMITDQINPANQEIFQAVFGMIFTVIIALEFKHSLLIVLARQESVVRVRSIVLIALLAVTRTCEKDRSVSCSPLLPRSWHLVWSTGLSATKTAVLRPIQTKR